MDVVEASFNWGQTARSQGQFLPAINCFTHALDVFHSIGAKNHDPFFWSTILFSRADVYLVLQRYDSAINDIKHALTDFPEQISNLEEATSWFDRGKDARLCLVAVCCYSAALHFAGGETRFQSLILNNRALSQYDLGNEPECEQDIEESKNLDFNLTLQIGTNLNCQGKDMYRAGDFSRAVHLLQLAEKFFRLLFPVKQSLKPHWYKCWESIIDAAWSGKMYPKAIQAGKKWRQMELITNEKEAVGWKDRGNEMFKQGKYDNAIECYTLSIQYAPGGNYILLGTLHSNRSQTFMKKGQFTKAKDDADECLKYRPDWSKSFYRAGSALVALKDYDGALEILKKGLDMKNAKPEDKYEIFSKIMTLVFDWEDGLIKINFQLPHDCLSRYMRECVVKHHWKSLEVFLLGGGGQQSYAKGKGGIATGNCDLKDISLCDVIKANPKPSMYYELIATLIDHGVLVNGRNENEIPLSSAVNCNDHDLAVILLNRDANPEGLIRSKSDHTAIHAAFKIGLTSGHWKVFQYLMENSGNSANSSTPCLETIDTKGNSLYHLAASGERMWHHALEGITLLKKYNIDPTTRNKEGKTPLMTLRLRNDPRYRLIDESVKSFLTDKPKKKKKKKKKKSEVIAVSTPTECKKEKNAIEIAETKLEAVTTSSVYFPTEIESLREKISQSIKHLPSEIKNEAECSKVEKTSNIDQNFTKNSEETCFKESSTSTLATRDEVLENKIPLPSHCLNVAPSREDDDEINNDDDVIDDDVSDVTFDNLTWEVECTADVWKTLKDKKLPRNKKSQIVSIIRELANGNMRGCLAKRLGGIAKESNILLFEAKLDKSARIIWERAIAFSPRCSENTLPDDKNGKRLYTEVIRIWDIVFDHDTVPRKIKKIVRSYDRGTNCFIKKNLKGIPVDTSSFSANNNQISIPNVYVTREDLDKLEAEYLTTNEKPCSSNESSKMFFPPGSPEETEYHILKFYAFSNAMVNAMLDNQNSLNFDFPFRVSELEHSVINLKPKPMTSILLLGRSGTGKTTCCLYRLWNNYQTYWQHHTLKEPSIPNTAQFIPRDTDDLVDSEQEEEGRNETSTCEERCATSSRLPQCSQTGTSGSHDAVQDDQGCCSSSLEAEHKPISFMEQPRNTEAVENGTSEESRCETDENEVSQAIGNERIYEHLHQAFITKNAVLCKEVKKNFLELNHACFSTQSDVDPQQSSSLYKFDQLEEQAWPLFICSRDWLLMLDASLPGKPFFPRDEDGKLLRSIKGWGEEDNNLQEIPVDYSEDEDDNDDDDDDEGNQEANGERDEQRSEGDLDPRREITYEVFKNELWRKMTKKKKVDYHPSLVWTEITSFLKGSVEALHTENGYISLEEYQTIGRKRASSFTADRETIYELFLAYERIKRSQGMFDEADVVNSIYHRLEHNVPAWSIHEIYVDETQDFTQAELSVIIRSCRNPNRLFFTGDTAQSIMRGIAFRFSDLRSLFFYMQESVKAVGQEAAVVVPDRVYELTHNYRSHSGILNLASCVTDLLLYFFPESFDRLARDQGLFPGPKPVLLESCSFSDLAVILRGHKRKTSPIEFGAHQVILVASDEVRESLPEELSLALVMTIYEAKGLEFDDVLIYNFFKDSQAQKEWRVVGTYKEEKQDEDTNVSETGIAEIPVDSLECKARPLEFNPDQHKILISEFKYLYTALTRARVNVWLFDENEEVRAPMFEYFERRGVVDVKQVERTEDVLASLEGMFAQKSKKEDWNKQGLFFYGKGLWKVASKCFHMAGEEMWVKKCNAHEQAAKAANLVSEPRKLRLEFVKAADLFLDCAMKEEAGKCLFNARERILLAQLHEKSGKFGRAAKIFQKEGKFVDSARNFERDGHFDKAVDCLLKVNHYTEVLNVISRHDDLLKSGKEISESLRFDQRSESICYQAAKFYLKRGETRRMTDALERLSSVEDRIIFLQKNGCFDQAAELLVGEGKAQEAARLMRSRGKFLEAARFSDDHKFVADCYLLAVRSNVLSKKNGAKNKEIEELIEGPLKQADEMYKRCNNINGQAEVKFVRGKFYEHVKDFEEAGELYCDASNYAAVAECFLLLMNTEKDPRRIHENRPKAITALRGLLHLILALHKVKLENSERTAISMCQVYFGLVDTDDVQTKKVPHLEMVRFTGLQNVKNTSTRDDKVPAKEADKMIKSHLSKMARNLIEQLWKKHQGIIDSCTACPNLLTRTTCDVRTCIYSHESLTRAHFGYRFYALLFLVHLEDRIAMFLKDMKRESAKVKNQLQQLLFVLPEFRACEWLYQLLFPCGGQFVSSHFLSERDVSVLRRRVPGRILEFAKSYLWYGSKPEDRWSSSDLFLKVSNLMHIAGAPVRYLYSLLSVEEGKFEKKSSSFEVPPGMFPDRRNPGRFNVFSKALERSKSMMYYGDILGSIHAAVKQFMFPPAKKRELPYPSITNAVMILERHLTACLVLYTRLMMNETIVCLPETYLSMINFWDFVDRPQTTRSTTLYNAIQYAPQFRQGPERRRKLDHLQELAWSMVALTFGEIRWEYDVVRDALCDTSVNLFNAERVLVLSLIMLCNCGRGIPEECEKMICEHLLTLPLRQDLPHKLTKCIEDVRNATGVQDVVICLRELLDHQPRQERLCDVKWDEFKAKDSRRNCQIEKYSKRFRYEIDVSALLENTERRQPEEQDVSEDAMNDNYSQILNEDETPSRRQEYDKDTMVHACEVIQRVFFKWQKRKEMKVKFEEVIKNDPIKSYFQPFKLDKSGCTICGQIDFVDSSSKNTETTYSQPLDHDEEETASSWRSGLLQTFETHCSKRSLHWKKEKSFANFKKFYKERVLPSIERATQLEKEMTKLKNETEVECSFDLDRLETSLSRLRIALKKIEEERSWDSVNLIDKAAEEVRKVTQSIQKTRSRKVGVKAQDGSVDQDSGDEDFADYNINDSEVGHLKDVNIKRHKKNNVGRKGKRK